MDAHCSVVGPESTRFPDSDRQDHVTPAALAQTGGEPEPGGVHTILVYLALA
jgi:hypothetical protein